MPDLDDHVEYQKQGTESEFSHVRGISRPVEVEGVQFGLAFHWRGKGWLMVASSSWEILGYGTDEAAESQNDYVVTYFGKTLFTPAGLDIYTRTKNSLSETTLMAIKSALKELGNDDIAKITDALFEIPRTAD